MSKLDESRKKINSIDKKMAKLYEERMDEVKEVAEYKIKNNMEVLDNKREKDIIEQNTSYIKNAEYKEYYLENFESVLELSKRYQRRLINQDKVAYQGVEGAFAYKASSELFPDSELVNYNSWEEVIKAIKNGAVKYGVLPYENSYTGEVGEVSDLLRVHAVYINQIYDLKINQNLLGIKGSKIEDIKEVYSHPQGLKQCAKFLKGRGIELKPFANTALAAKHVADAQDKSKAAIASKDTAELYDLDILESDIETSEENTTRFVVLSKELIKKGNTFQIIFDVRNETGTLASAINLISSYNLNMISIKSRSIPKNPWEYYFQVEIEGDLNDPQVNSMLEELKSKCTMVKILGAYKR